MNTPNSSLKNELIKAKRLNDRFGRSCLDDAHVKDLFLKYRELIAETDALMETSGVVAACTRCAASTRGGCCFKGMDDDYGFMLLYINLLLGSAVSEIPAFPEICHFIGSKGCELKARHSFCLNYFCPDLKHSLGEKIIAEIRASVGSQLLAGWELELALNSWIAHAAGVGCGQRKGVACPNTR